MAGAGVSPVDASHGGGGSVEAAKVLLSCQTHQRILESQDPVRLFRLKNYLPAHLEAQVRQHVQEILGRCIALGQLSFSSLAGKGVESPGSEGA